MADTIENYTLDLLREIREEQRAFNEEQRATNARLETKIDRLETKVDKLGIELIGVRGRVRKVEETLESIARILSEGVLTGR